MNTVGINTSALANAVTPFSPVGRQAVGLENADAKGDIITPVEESPSSSAAFNREAEAREADDAARQDRRLEARGEQQQQTQQQTQDQSQVRALAARDREVHAHEQAHASAGGRYAGSPSYTFERGPDGVSYAVSGEVPISLPTGGGDPQAALVAAQQIIQAALAPADPSPQDRNVAAQASHIATESRADISQQQTQEQVEQREETEAGRIEAQQQEDTEQETQDEGKARDERLAGLRQSAQRSNQLDGQLITQNNIDSEFSAGAVLDQLA